MMEALLSPHSTKNPPLIQLRPILERLMAEARESDAKTARYWYPLTSITYQIEEVLGALDSLCRMRTTMGEKTAEFERGMAGLLGSKEAIMVNSGSSADLLMTFALVNRQVKRLMPGDEILVPAVTWPTQIWSAVVAGLSVRLVDVDPSTLNVDLKYLEQNIGERTRAIYVVHLMGNPCNMEALMKLAERYDLVVIEDCCESLGATFDGKTVGTFGVSGSFSFFHSHHITTMEGGMVVCDDEELSDVFRMLRAHGWTRNTRYTSATNSVGIDPRFVFLNVGFNLRPTELQAAFGLAQLKRLPAFNRQRMQNVSYVLESLRQHMHWIAPMQTHPKARCSWFALPFILTKACPFTKTQFLSYLEEQGIETRPIVTGNVARQPAIEELYPEMRSGDLPGADVIHDRGFYVGVHPVKAIDKLDRLVDVFDTFLRRF
jgi:dTDP-4-amino-4,6-dideoxygalactose transaminase